MKQTSLFKQFFLLVLLLVGSTTGALADEVTITLSEQGYSNEQKIASTTSGDVTLTYNKGTSSTDPAYYNVGTGVRVYAGSNMTITANSNTITKVIVTFAKNNNPTIYINSNGTNTSTETESPAEWVGSATEVYFNVTNKGHARIQSVAVTYEGTSAKALTSIELSGTYPTSFYVGNDFSHEGMTVTANYDDESTKDVTAKATFSGYDMANAGNQTVTVSYTENEITKTTNYNITVNALPTYNVTYNVDGVQTILSDQIAGTVLNTILPTPKTSKANYVFKGWLTTTLDATDAEPTYYDISQTLSGDLTLYAVFAKETPGTSTTTTDELTNANTIGKTTSSYSDWSNKTDKSDAVYAGNSAGSNATIQLRTNNSNSGIVTTTSGGKAKKVVVDWHSGTVSGRTIDIYGKDTAYGAASDLYNNSKQGTKLGSLAYDSETELTIDGDYEYIGIRSNSDALYLNSISIDWETGTPATYSNYCTTIVAKLSAELSIDPTEITMALSDEDKTITVTTADGYNGDITVESSDDGNFLADNSTNKRIVDLYAIEAGEYTVTVKASATAEYEAAQVVCNVTVTKNPSEVAFMTDEAEIVIEEQKTFTLSATTATGYDGVVTYALSENTCDATIEGATVTVSKKGSVKVTATAPETATFAASEASYTLTVTSEVQATEVETNLNHSIIGTVVEGSTDNFEIDIDGVTMSVDKGTGVAPRGDDTYIRIYNNNKMTFTAPAGYVMTAIAFTRPSTSSDWKSGMSADCGNYSDNTSAQVNTWTGTESKVTFTPGGTHRLASVAITLAPGTNVTDAEWATYVTVVNTDFANSTGIKAYKAVNTTADGIKLEEITEAPKGTAVVIAADEDGYVLTEAASTPAAVTGNILQVSDGTITGDYNSDTKESTYYVLGKNTSDEVGFGPLAKGVKLAKGKAYIHKNDWDTATAKDFLPFIINEESSETTSISEELRVKSEESSAYNLAGQKVSKDYKGIVVVNGKKFVRK